MTAYDDANSPVTVTDNQNNNYKGVQGDTITYAYDQIGYDGRPQRGLLSSMRDGQRAFHLLPLQQSQ